MSETDCEPEWCHKGCHFRRNCQVTLQESGICDETQIVRKEQPNKKGQKLLMWERALQRSEKAGVGWEVRLKRTTGMGLCRSRRPRKEVWISLYMRGISNCLVSEEVRE